MGSGTQVDHLKGVRPSWRSKEGCFACGLKNVGIRDDMVGFSRFLACMARN